LSNVDILRWWFFSIGADLLCQPACAAIHNQNLVLNLQPAHIPAHLQVTKLHFLQNGRVSRIDGQNLSIGNLSGMLPSGNCPSAPGINAHDEKPF
jgi:hypothetical protein